MFMFEKLEVYQKATGFANNIISLTESMPKGLYSLKDQLIRAAISIPANIAEGNGRWHKRDKHNFFVIARGSCFECVPLSKYQKPINSSNSQSTRI
jgi:four helix bundle protein